MKSILSTLATFALILGLSSQVFAWGGYGGRVAERAVKTGAKVGAESHLNKKLAKMPCKWGKKSTRVEPDNCNLDTIINELESWATGLGASGTGSLRTYVNMSGGPNNGLCRQRGRAIVDTLRGRFAYGSWNVNWRCSDNASEGGQALIHVKAR